MMIVIVIHPQTKININILYMECGICNKCMKKDIKIDDIRTCYQCRMIFVKAYNKIHRYAVKHKEELAY